jgi:cation transporter-like permease
MFFTEITGKLTGAIICLLFFFAALIVLQRNRKNPRFMKTIKEALLTIIVVAFLVNITGSVLSRISRIIRKGSEVYIAYPALINTMGDVGAIVGSTATTKLALGTMDSSLESVKKHWDQIAGALTASIVTCFILALLSSFIQIPGNTIAMMQFVFVILITNIFSALFMICIVLSIAILAFHRGLDPDNFVIPIESSLADVITTTCLFLAVSVLG